ncbi:hypothetical protein FPV67DRAFT_583429 [Lyophyllum atratum]|nr:hypothetical protein FPV67DRAFT_583429 [Lyophyllum atratum]
MASNVCSTSTSLMWPALIALMPRDLVQVTTILAGIIILITTLSRAVHPKTIMGHLDSAIHHVDEKVRSIHGAMECGEYNEKEIVGMLAALQRLQLQAAELREKTFRASVSSWKELQHFCCGNSVRILMRLREVDKLDAQIDVRISENRNAET